MRIRYLHTEGFRLSAIYTLVFALSVLAMGGIVLAATGKALRDQIIQSARTDIGAMQRGYAAEGADEVREVIGQLMGAPGESDFFLLQRDGRHIAGNLPPMAAQTGIVEIPAAEGREAVLGVGNRIAPGLYAFAGTGLNHVLAVQARILRALSWVFATALLLAVLGGALVSRSFLSRTDAMARACRVIMDGDLKARLPMRGTRDALDQLAAAVNEMLDRIARLMHDLGQVTNDIAHDLRTPVTHLRQRLERAKNGNTDPAGYSRALDAAIEKTDEILAMFAALLRIVQIEGGSRRAAFTQVELAPLLDHLREIFAPVAEGAGHSLTADIVEGAAIRGDRALLVQLFSNLIENAILHTPEGTHIRLALTRPRAGLAAVTVSDDGPGVPAEEHAKLFHRLYRREASRGKPGYGLGLSLVAAIAELHGTRAEIVPGEQGLSVRVTFAALP